MAKKDSANQKKAMSRLFRGKAIFKPLNTGRIDARVACVREWIANIFFYTKNGVTIMIDDEYLFTGDTIWFGTDGGYSFLSTLAEDNRLAVQSLEKLEKILRSRKQPIRIITGHTGWTDDPGFAFRHRTEICKPFTKKYIDPSAPYDGYVEDDDTEEGARNTLLAKVRTALV